MWICSQDAPHSSVSRRGDGYKDLNGSWIAMDQKQKQRGFGPRNNEEEERLQRNNGNNQLPHSGGGNSERHSLVDAEDQSPVLAPTSVLVGKSGYKAEMIRSFQC